MSLWPATVSSVCLCCPGASPTNTTSFLKWLIPEKGSTRSCPPSSSTNDGSTWANTAAALNEIYSWIFWAHIQTHKLILTLSSYYVISWLLMGRSRLSFSIVTQQGQQHIKEWTSGYYVIIQWVPWKQLITIVGKILCSISFIPSTSSKPAAYLTTISNVNLHD